MRYLICALLLTTGGVRAQETMADLARRYLVELTRLDTTNPPGNETRVARYLEQVARQEGLIC
jgi:phosphohistidine phosphatase SixA